MSCQAHASLGQAQGHGALLAQHVQDAGHLAIDIACWDGPIDQTQAQSLLSCVGAIACLPVGVRYTYQSIMRYQGEVSSGYESASRACKRAAYNYQDRCLHLS